MLTQGDTTLPVVDVFNVSTFQSYNLFHFM